MANINNSKILYIFFTFGNDNLLDFNIMSQRDRVTYVANVAYKARFALFANVFVIQLCNFSSLKTNWFHIIQSIIYKPKLEKT